MLFNSYEFILLFLPVCLIGFGLLGRTGRIELVQAWLLVASLVFYVWWSPSRSWVLGLSLVLNFVASRWLVEGSSSAARRRRLLHLAVVGNVVLLAGFKLAVFWAPAQAGRSAGFTTTQELLLPLGISFFTFQQIAYLLDVHRGRVKLGGFREYVLFVTFFPQLVMGPIVHYRDLQPQLRSSRLLGLDPTNLAVGLAIFSVGLFKKVVLADGLAPLVDAAFGAAARGERLGGLTVLAAAVAFQFQLFFDFSGYADMAIGLGRMFGVALPINFDAPLRAVDRFDLWRRWHITFSEFMRGHVFVPLSRFLARLWPGHTGASLALALLATTFVSGLWHGVGWSFVAWGLLHGVLMLMSHAWKGVRPRFGLGSSGSLARWRGVGVTFLISTLVGLVFRAKDLDTAWRLCRDLFGSAGSVVDITSSDAWLLLPLGAAIVWLLPDTPQLFERYWTAYDPRGRRAPQQTLAGPRFALDARWAWAAAALLTLALVSMGRSARFVYYQF